MIIDEAERSFGFRNFTKKACPPVKIARLQ